MAANKCNLPEINQSKKLLNLSKHEWNEMTQLIYEKSENEREIEMMYAEYLKNGSREMTKNWDNTIEKIRQRKVAALKKKEEQRKAEGLSRFLRMFFFLNLMLHIFLFVIFRGQ